MGLFDEVRCEYPLPDPAHQNLLFQTKDLEKGLEQYLITRRGRLVRTRSDWLTPRERRDACPIHQDLRIYDSVEVGPDEREWVEYVFRFTEGKVTRVRRSKDRHRYRVGRSDSQSEPRLEPGLDPRRPTPEEFSAHTPEKLELFDGHVPGEEKLLLLLLTTIGLRSAARLVGPNLWRKAAARVRLPMIGPKVRARRKHRR
jgi:hypothetical protein